MTKKLTDFIKRQNKSRRQALLYVKNLLENKAISLTIEQEIGTSTMSYYGMDPEMLDTGERKLTLEWKEKRKWPIKH